MAHESPDVPASLIVDLVEVGPRDGLQNESRTLPVEVRARLIERLVDAGVRRLEAVSFVRPDLVPQMAEPERVLDLLPAWEDGPDVTLIGLVLNRRGAERAVATRVQELNMVVPVTDGFATRNQGASVEALLDQAADVVSVARDAGRRVSVTLPVSFGCPFDGDVHPEQVAPVVERVLAMGVDELAFADTIGVGVPPQVEALASLVPEAARGATLPHLRFHFHNTRNTGYANAWAATRLDLAAYGGRVALDSSVGGFGGCPFAPAATGNIGTEDLVHLLRRGGVRVSDLDDVDDLSGLIDTAAWLSTELGSPVQALLGRAGDRPGVAVPTPDRGEPDGDAGDPGDAA
ncbi:hydroxymethylglutaryl-CoA lyase [Nocardioides sp. TRM66260-LWL]|uniref:hydroxymethylglutaryl-CoA lyase n=1 Tax=Nocardioides sp. TRM66260-LWL TaxID=2874478 RepID=UPI001CC56C15|nr:hydroxymethylglutaryl-CoA lyase [Nocardioides sp. TRM66260-LWL]MBZ5735603.1 hydroxymethylglutaryl-CoA lyase [Nocardioides sp. TRM66260-LWL]